MLSHKLVKNILLILLLTAGIIFCGMTWLCLDISGYDKSIYESKCNIERTGFMSNDMDLSGFSGKVDIKNLPTAKFYNALKSSGLTKKCGQYYLLGHADIDRKYVSFQKGHSLNPYGKQNCIEATYMQKDILDILDLQYDPVDSSPGLVEYGILLGWAYKEKFGNQTYITFKGKKCPVIGYLKKDEQLPYQDILISEPAMSEFYNANYSFVQIIPDDWYQGFTVNYILADGITFSQFQTEVKKIARKYNVTVEKNTLLRDHITKHTKENIHEMGSLIPLSITLILGVMLLIIVAEVSSIFSSSNLYGIFYSVGMSKSKIACSIILENMMIIMLSYIISCVVLYNGLYLFAQYYCEDFRFAYTLIRRIFSQQIILQQLLVSVLLIVITSIVPICFFSKCTPVTLMKRFYK